MYIEEMKMLVVRDIKDKKRAGYFRFLNMGLRIIKIIPFKKIKSTLTKKLLRLPPRVLYKPNQDFYLQKK